MSDPYNATFYCFKPTGKYYTHERGFLRPSVFEVFGLASRRAQIVEVNEGCYPGLITRGEEFTFVVIPDPDCTYGFPLMLPVVIGAKDDIG